MFVHPFVQLHFELLEQIRAEKDPEKKKLLCMNDIELYHDFCNGWIMEADDKKISRIMFDRRIGEEHPPAYYEEKYKSAYTLPRYSSFKELAILYEKEGDYKSAIDVCKEAIEVGQTNDGTKGGMTARMERLRKKMAK